MEPDYQAALKDVLFVAGIHIVFYTDEMDYIDASKMRRDLIEILKKYNIQYKDLKSNEHTHRTSPAPRL